MFGHVLSKTTSPRPGCLSISSSVFHDFLRSGEVRNSTELTLPQSYRVFRIYFLERHVFVGEVKWHGRISHQVFVKGEKRNESVQITLVASQSTSKALFVNELPLR